MTPETLRFQILSQPDSDFAPTLQLAASVLREAPGCLGVELLRSTQHDRLWLLSLLWTSGQRSENFRRLPGFTQFMALIQPFAAEMQELDPREPVGDSWVPG
ncbi:antibiotic biosynthesis monooxygenase [Derxia lacustris]|uniref:antibiotic biosynthesis monooxygenase n=1 Tax=Derxia lacustris TaxID=764842 RepID=UPI000A1784C7|nr:antibiotic biosynthesis monooxygenase [Derxia lacustris]